MNIIVIKKNGTREEAFWDVSDDALDFFVAGSNDFDLGDSPGKHPHAMFQRVWKQATYSDGTHVCNASAADCKELSACPDECAECVKFTPCLVHDKRIAYEIHEDHFAPYKKLADAHNAWDEFVAEHGVPGYDCDIEFWDAESIYDWIESHSS